MIVIVSVLKSYARGLPVLGREAVEMSVDGRGVIVIGPGMHVLERRYKECLQQGEASWYRGNETHPLTVYRMFAGVGR